MRNLSLVAICFLLLAGSTLSQQSNSPEATLVVNENDQGAFPRQSFMGRLDAGMVNIEGGANSEFFLLYGTFNNGSPVSGLGTIHVDLSQAFGVIPGLLDASGRFDYGLAPGDLDVFSPGSLVSLQALIADPLAMFGFAVSGATQIEVVSTMTAPLLLTPGENSVARARGEVVSASATEIVIAGITMVVTPNTQFANFTLMSQLVPGDWIVAQGLYDANGAIIAQELDLEDSELFARIKGRVQGVGPSGFSVLNVGVFTNNDTVFVDLDAPGVPVTLADLQIGMMIEFTAEVGLSFVVAASTDLNAPFEFEPEPEDEPEPEPETEDEIEIPPSFCS